MLYVQYCREAGLTSDTYLRANELQFARQARARADYLLQRAHAPLAA
jgi:hypothetical protein